MCKIIRSGEVVTCGDNEVEVSVMHRSGNSWK